MVFVLVLFWVLANNFSSLNAQNISEVLEKIQYFYENIKNLRADFLQETTFLDGSKEIRTGKVWIKKPGKFRWEYESPEKFLIVSDGVQIFIYYPEEKEVLIYPSGKIISSQLALGFMSGRGNIKKDLKLESFEILNKKEWKISFIPISKDTYIEKIILMVNLDTGEVKELYFINTVGEKIRIVFKNLKYNLDLGNNLFTFIPPKNSKLFKALPEN
ncbi:MAG: Outer membrane lipoprotein-sorting protein [Thermodesulfobacterium sp.]|uniref:Outer membrane lipoprotein-sorting protein n=1 Tax=Candidatus Thermodesulfobacterium syntrophicum TaxID=3060442 RepID=A0AAE3P3C9_9BACT|nr:Outer membrane lipoprotein-sorting protein [Candidatus Thermodesulfobacterium syntrophicum]